MRINQYWFWELPKKLTADIYVVFDVWSATTNLSLILSQKPKKLLITNERKAVELKKDYPDGVLLGESTSSELPFEVSNYPNQIARSYLNNKIIIFTTTNGTKIFEALITARLTLGCSFNNMKAVIDFIRRKKLQQVDIVMAGDRQSETPEDRLAADYFRSRLTNQPIDWEQIKAAITNLFKTNYCLVQPKAKGDSEIILQKDRYSIVPALTKTKESYLEIRDLI